MTEKTSACQLPVFPLNLVVFPDGHLPLRIFEPRYVDMVARCSREGIGFVVAAIEQGGEAGAPATPHLIGTEVRIEDWNKEDSGLLLIDCRGMARVKLKSSWLQDDGLRLAEVEHFAADPFTPVAEEFEALWQILDQLGIQTVGEKQRNASWLCGRLVENLPLPIELKQELLCEADPNARLARLNSYLIAFFKA